MAIHKNGEILFQDYHSNSIQLLLPDGEVKSVLDTSLMMVLAIHVYKDNYVIVGLKEQGQSFPVQNFFH